MIALEGREPTVVTTGHLPLFLLVGMAVTYLILALYFAYWVFARYAYEISEDTLSMRRWVFGSIPGGRLVIPLHSVAGVRRAASMDTSLLTACVFGQLYSTRGILLILRRPYLRVFRSIYITPESPSAFIEQMRARLDPSEDAAERPHRLVVGRALRRLLWLADMLALVSAAAAVPVAWTLIARPPLPLLWHAVYLLGYVLATGMWGWMALDALMHGRRRPEGGFRPLVWLVVTVLPGPGPWIYYLAVWRRRQVVRAG
jgi:hypothetical protein